jgi:hypothetical protein
MALLSYPAYRVSRVDYPYIISYFGLCRMLARRKGETVFPVGAGYIYTPWIIHILIGRRIAKEARRVLPLL